MRNLWLGLCVLAASVSCAQQKATAPVILITPDDLNYWAQAEKNLKTRGGKSAPVPAPGAPLQVEAVETSGPEIKVLTPKTALVDTPVELEVRFAPHGAVVDPNSIRVTVKKWIFDDFRFGRDITDRVRPYISTAGIHVPEAPMPAGTYQFVLHVADTAQKGSSVRLVLAVIPKN